jgi:hypothetical protein
MAFSRSIASAGNDRRGAASDKRSCPRTLLRRDCQERPIRRAERRKKYFFLGRQMDTPLATLRLPPPLDAAEE